ncbi:porin family protein [Winogradskyella sp. R77965]|uniref:porin family protein n=1 Tax=Winogradskyella sp. R77965 TaxID=3093872 RepID=UPI0037DBFF1C
MKKLLLVAIVTFGLSNSVSAQSIDYGLKAGLNLANLNGADDASNLTSFHVGGFAEIELSEKFSLQPELLYSRQGAKEQEDDVKIKLDYLSIPIMAKYYVAEKFSLEFGPQMGFLINDKIVFDDSDAPDVETDGASFDLGLNIGVGLDVTSNLFTQLRYSYGITTVVESPDFKTSVFQISLGYKF